MKTDLNNMRYFFFNKKKGYLAVKLDYANFASNLHISVR